MIIKNKLTKETIELKRSDFEMKFSKEIKTALESYKRTELSKPYFRMNKNIHLIYFLYS